MNTLLVAPVQPALPHAIPFRIFLEEHRRRREADLHAAAAAVFARMLPPPPGASTELQILHVLTQQETAYRDLRDASDELAKGQMNLKLDGCMKRCAESDAPLKLILHNLDSSALCLSGGGIRSASFSLGVLEGLARYSRRGSKAHRTGRLMRDLDYLSTVSGGGYIGSWLMAWVYRRKIAADKPTAEKQAPEKQAPEKQAPEKQAPDKQSANTPTTPVTTARPTDPAHTTGATVMSDKPWEQAYAEVLSALAGYSNVTSGDPEPMPIRHLRSYTSFLAPELGLTLDTFTLAAIILRNLMVNWTMLIPVLIALVAAAETSAYLFATAARNLRTGTFAHPIYEGLPWLLGRMTWGGLVIGACFAITAWSAGKVLPSHRDENAVNNNMVVVFLSGVVVGCWLTAASATGEESWGLFWSKFAIALIGFALLATSIIWSYLKRASKRGAATRKGLAVTMAAIAIPTMSAVTAGLLYWVQGSNYFGLLRDPHSARWAAHGSEGRLFTVFAMPSVLLVLALSATLFSALMGMFETEDDREWWVRSGGALLAIGLGWMLIHGFALYGRDGLLYARSGVIGLGLGLFGSTLGFSTATAATKVSGDEAGKAGKFLVRHNLVLPVIGGASLLLITLGMVGVEEKLRRLLAEHLFGQSHHAFWTHGLQSSALLFAIASLLSWLINLAISINLFSLSGMYRMRLVRAFLGASNVYRHPDPFTQFDWRDSPYQTDLPCEPGAPLHLVNTTLNLAGTKNAAWRQRKGEGFSFSALCSGGWRVGYVRADQYGGSKGTTLATAMAISGAAANPNMGYQTSPLLALLMTFFNLRLGYWLPNPARAVEMDTEKQGGFLRSTGPSFALWPLFAEALGSTDDRFKWIELTDGGHFENLGLYEMVLRRCKHIVVVDASADPKFGFEDLGNAIRKIQIDLGIPIEFIAPTNLQKSDEPLAHLNCAVAEIQYACVDQVLDVDPSTLVGHLVYIKPANRGTVSADVLQYARTHATFPHEATGNQFFTESQFESYRRLGSYTVDQIATQQTPGDGFGMEGFYAAAEKYTSLQDNPPSDVQKPA